MCSDAMHHLAIPTTRALSLVTTGEIVVRDMFYDGNPQPEPARSFARRAYFRAFSGFSDSYCVPELDELRVLADYVIDTHILATRGYHPEKYVRWFEEICSARRRSWSIGCEWDSCMAS
jgi:uncharacterized protein YdiU (UPF0061 family)